LHPSTSGTLSTRYVLVGPGKKNLHNLGVVQSTLLFL
jgi:hypothetical protein